MLSQNGRTCFDMHRTVWELRKESPSLLSEDGGSLSVGLVDSSDRILEGFCWFFLCFFFFYFYELV